MEVLGPEAPPFTQATAFPPNPLSCQCLTMTMALFWKALLNSQYLSCTDPRRESHVALKARQA